MAHQLPLTISDIPWLRLAAGKNGAVEVPFAVSAKLLSGGFVQRDRQRNCLTITARGELALNRLT